MESVFTVILHSFQTAPDRVWLMVVGRGYKSLVVGVGVGVSNITN